ncbi:MAG TPA: fibronectin type III domain-containing protein, partial [Verrucomicrobiae bacterium]|nr:fibronectin type III domain-containing protein [Verrucomicrobiae bacterium]
MLLTWTASTSPNIVGYNIYYGTSSNAYTNEISAGNISSLTISNLAVGTTYYFAASAVNSSGIQSALSSPTSYTVTLPVPLLTITNVTSGMHVTNSTFKVMGVATDSVTVAGVYCSFNGGAYTPVSLLGIQWNMTLALMYGSNTLSAYAVDINGTSSSTNTVSIDYTPMAVMTVQTTGQGAISPNYNGSWLQVGATYSMTATPANGFAFNGWTSSTNGNFSAYTNGSTVQFAMFSNLVMQANFLDTSKPFVSITNITPGMHVTNGFTAMGLATDNVAVTSVQYSLNGGAFVPAAIAGNVWSSALLSLNLGSNSLAIYSTDGSGNVSTTSTVIFDYVVSAPLTVQTNGNGSVNPNYNGSSLQVGAVYTMTATAAKGFEFGSWTGSTNGTFTTYTNGPTVQFTMFSNLVMQANFTDTNNPFINITNITSGMHITNGYTAMGLATDNVAVASVQYSLNGGAFVPAAVVGNVWSSAPLSLNLGSNSLAVYATDINGNVSATGSVLFDYVVSAILTVQTNGNGSVNPNYNGTSLQIGANYTMTATAAKGFAFSSWTGSTNGAFTTYTNGPIVQFRMFSNLVMQANFTDTNNPFVSITNITSGMHVTNGFTAMGLATDNVAVASVQYSLNGGPFVPANIAGNVWSSAPLSLNIGSNSLAVYSTDSSSNVSATSTVLFDYVVSATLTVQTNGEGIINPNYNGSVLNIGAPYTMTATPINGFAFSSWTGSTNGNFTTYTNGPTVQFTMFSNLVMQANFTDTNNPFVSITNITPGMQVNTETFTAMGLATDNVAVASVQYSLNGGPFAPASITGNSWMSALLSLNPGTNTLAVYATDTNSNVSATATVSFNYIVSATLTVQANGEGFVTPNYNGSLLQVGAVYSMTAMPTNGFAFSSWTGSTNGTFTPYTSSPTVQFTMLPNLVMQANFVDTNNPVVSITNITPGMQVTTETFTAMGLATDNVAVASVQYSLNGGPFVPAAITNNSWSSAQLTLNPGTNTLAVYATDTSGNVSATATAGVNYVVSAALTVQTNGNGFVSPNYNGALLQIGGMYTMTATPTNGFAFSSWTGSTNGIFTSYTNGPTVQFEMFSNLVMQANFVDTNAPSISIANVTSGMQVSVANLTVFGVATDNVGISNVFYSLNGAPFAPTPIKMNGNVWSVPLSFVPGTNTIAVYAVDPSGNVSATAVGAVDYVVLSKVTVQSTGPGYINPNYNGLYLQIGTTYSMTAHGTNGFGIGAWTGSTNGVQVFSSNVNTLQFTMLPNLVVQANFVDTNAPFISIDNIPPALAVSNADFTVEGTATDNVAVASVQYSLNGGPFAPAAITNNTWGADLALMGGTNTIAAYAMDAAGNVSATNTASIAYVQVSMLTVKASGKGSINN